MAYTPIGWLNDQAPAINQTNLNKMDNKIYDLDKMDSYYDNLFNQTVVISTNRVNLNALSNIYILSSGVVSGSSNFKTSDYIPVTPGEVLNFWSKNSSNLYANQSYRVVVAYNANKEFLSDKYSEYVNNTYTVPSGVYFIRLTNANTEWAKDDIYVGVYTLVESNKYEEYGVAVSAEHEAVENNRRDIDNITRPSTNKLNVDTLIYGYMTTNGVLHPDVLFVTTDFIEVSENETLFGWGKNNGVYSTIRFRFVIAFDSSKNVLEAKGSSSITTEFTVPSGVKYIKITMYSEEINNYTNRYVGSHALGIDYEPYGVVIDMENIHIEDEITYTCRNGESILEAVKYCYDHNIKTLKVEAGNYDIIAEYKSFYGSDYFDNYTDYSQDRFDAGIWLENIKVIFSSAAKVVCKYTGNNSNVQNYFCAFATGNNVEIDGLVLDASNLRYGIHSDFNTGSDDTFFIMRNCDIKHVRFDGNKCIGAGFGTHVTWTFENCIFRTTGNYYAVRIHNNFSGVAQSKVIVKDCYIDGDGFFLFTSYGSSTANSIIQICGCSYANIPVVQKETPTSEDNIILVAWNNEIRE